MAATDTLLFAKSRSYARAYQTFPTRITVDALRPTAQTFADSVARIDEMLNLPVETAYWSGVFSCHRAAALERTGGFGKGEETIQSRGLADLMFNAWLQGKRTLRKEAFDDERWEDGLANFLELIYTESSGELRRGVEALMASTVIMAWAAFETLALDLWVDMLNLFPTPLALQFCEKNNNKQVSLGLLARSDFDVSHSMGNILLDRAGMQDVGSISAAYQHAFRSIEVFDRHPKLRMVEVIRNLFAHRSGHVDRRFVENAKKFAEIKDFIAGEKLPLNGDLAASCVDVCVEAGVELVQFADHWVELNDHSAKCAREGSETL